MSWAELFYPKGIKAEDVKTVEAVRGAFANLGIALESLLPEGRYKAIIRTELEKTAALSTKAFTHPN